MKKLAGWLLGIVIAMLALSFVTRALRDAAFAYGPPVASPAPAGAPAPPAPPLSTDCVLSQAALADCTVVLSSDPAAYGVSVEDMRGQLLHELCVGLARRTDGERGDMDVHVLYPNRTRYADFQLKADECR